MNIEWAKIAFGAIVIVAQFLSLWFVYWLFKKLRKPKPAAPGYSPGTGLDGKAFPVLSLLHSISIRARAGKSREELSAQARNAVRVICD